MDKGNNDSYHKAGYHTVGGDLRSDSGAPNGQHRFVCMRARAVRTKRLMAPIALTQ